MEIFTHGGIHYDVTTEREVVSHVEEILSRGQEGGEFREFDVRVMAALVQRSVGGILFLLEAHPDLDPSHYARETLTLFEVGTRRGG